IEKKRQILDSAIELFSTVGYQQTSIQDITKHAGISTGTFYLYYKSKVEIFRSIALEGLSILTEHSKKAVKQSPDNIQEQLIALARVFYQFYQSYYGYYKIFTFIQFNRKEYFQDQTIMEEVYERMKDTLNILEKVIERGMKEKVIQSNNSMQTALLLWGMMDGIFQQKIRISNLEIDIPIDDLIREAVQVIFNGIFKTKISKNH
ncbi:MAG: TetR/AcrR family transcriptional regulator, partial [Spirochaetes bacterium]|nr:TetR/AcrR family transcriptional regulator [Spirochaetota bacterium]